MRPANAAGGAGAMKVDRRLRDQILFIRSQKRLAEPHHRGDAGLPGYSGHEKAARHGLQL